MPLSELYRLAKRRVDSNQDFEPGNDVFELVWQNGQITTTQGKSSRARNGNSLPSHCLPSYKPKSRDRDLVGNGTASSRTWKFGTSVDSAMNEIPLLSVPSEEVGLSHDDDDMIPWLNYQIDAPLQAEYCPDFLPELSGVTANEVSKSGNFASSNDKSSCNQAFRESGAVSVDCSAGLEQRNVSKIVGGDSIRPRTGSSQLYPASSSRQHQASFPSFRSRGDGSARHAVCSNSGRASPTDFPSPKIQKQDSLPPGTSAGVINFSHFSRPVALARANSSLQSMPSVERMSNRDEGGFAANLSNSPPKLGTIDSSSGLRKGPSLQWRRGASSGVDLKQLDGRPIDKPRSGGRDSEEVCRDDDSKNDVSSNRIACESTTRGSPDGEKNTEPVIASSSVCSGNSAERASDDPTHVLKRKFRDTEDSECHSEDVEEESVGVKKTSLPRASGSKRSRAAEVHNLSERRRRDRINDKMRALQELIPNCNKVDKASMLDEAIEYLKTLQLQVQIMSMGAGLYMPLMMLPHFPPMGMGMGMGMGLGMGFGMGIPDMSGGFQGPHFPGPPVQALAGHGLQVFGLPGQGISVPMQRPQLVPMMGGPFMKPAVAMNASKAGGSVENTGSGSQSNAGANNSSMNQTPSQCQAMNEGFDRSASAQSNAKPSDANAGKVSASNHGNDAGPSRSTNYD